MKKLLIKNAFVFNTEKRDFIKHDVLIAEGKFSAFDPIQVPNDTETIDLCGKFIVPGLIDVHTHGRSGSDFNRHERIDYKKMLSSYARAGTTSVFATLASDTYESLLSSIDSIKSAIKNKPVCAGTNIIGVHLEGRYLNPTKRGAHDPSLLKLPSITELEEIIDRTSPMPVHITVAPELEGGFDFIGRAVELGATVGIGHSDADAETSKKALMCGATSFTHLFNTMRPIHHREPGNACIGLVSDAYAEVICDGYHLHPDIVKLAFLAKGTDRLVLITDSMEAAGNGDGEYEIAGMPVTVKNGCATTHDGAIAGSLLNLFDAVINLCRFANVKYTDALVSATKTPAEMVGVYDKVGSISIGKQADFLVLNSGHVTDSTAPVLEKVCIGGIFADQ